MTASPAIVESGGFSTLSWNATNAESCEASGGWTGSRATSGSEQVGPIESDTDFRLSCTGASGGVQRQVTVSVDAGNGASLTLRADPEQIPVNGSSTLTWSSENATSCTASGDWSGARDTSGSFSTGPLTESATYTLSCSGPSGNALATVTVEVLDKVLRWQAPTQNVDGSPLTDLAGFNVYWGTESRAYGAPHTINDPTATQWEVDLPPGRYHFALTAFDREGSESAYSNEVIKTIL
ncbi:MAG TPA: hypothetical protein VF210_05485 [Pseudomonadales bacterium]